MGDLQLADLILNINLDESRKRGHLVIDTYEGSIPHLKSRQYSGPLRNVNINGVSAVDNLSSVDFELVRELLNKPSNLQVSKNRYLLGNSSLSMLETFAHLGCLFYKQRKNPMYQIDSVTFSAPPQKCAIQLEGASIGSNKTSLYVLVEDYELDNSPIAVDAKAYVDLKGNEHRLRLVFDYNSYIVEYGSYGFVANKTDVLRDYGFESRVVAAIRAHGWRQDGEFGLIYKGSSFAEDVYSLRESGIAVYTESKKAVVKADFSDVRVSYGIDWFDVSGSVSVGDQELDIGELIDIASGGSQWIELKDGVFRIPTVLQKAKLSLDDSGTPKLAKAQLSSAIELAYELNGEKVKGLEKLVDYRDIDLDIDESIANILRPYQETGVKWLISLQRNGFGGCLADDMGLGKTLQVIAYLSDSSMSGKHTLVVTPKTLLSNWQREFGKFSPEMPVRIYHGANRDLNSDDMRAVLITTYGTLLNDIDQFRTIHFTNLVIDEAQYIKNPASKIHKAIKEIDASTRIILTGTPLENNIREYWGLMKLINPETFVSIDPFSKYADQEVLLEKVRRMTSPFLLRRMKEDVLPDLPEKREQTIYCSMDDDQRAYYEKMLASIRHELKRKGSRFEIKTNSAMLRGLLYLQEICCHPSLLDADLNPERCTSSVKFDLLLELLDDLLESGHKVVVFSRFTRMLRLIEAQIIRRHYNYYYLDGTTTHRLDIVDEFENSANGVFLISLKAGGTGINLVSADTVIIYDPWWNPASEKQAEDRVFRIGQTKDVMVYRLIVEDSIEEKVQRLQEEKKRLYSQILYGHEAPTSVTAEEMMKLLME